MATGVISYFNSLRGFGWISTPDLTENVFVHATDFDPEFGPRGQGNVAVGTKVEFELEIEGDGSCRARFVKAEK